MKICDIPFWNNKKTKWLRILDLSRIATLFLRNEAVVMVVLGSVRLGRCRLGKVRLGSYRLG